MFWVAALLLATTACVEPVQVPQPDDGELYPISFRVQTQDDELLTKAGGPLSGEDALVSSLFMYCFDSNGRYLGRYQATVLTQEQMQYTETQTFGTFKGEIPPATARIHFVANADCPVGGDYIGMTEEQVMHAPGLVYRKVSDDPSKPSDPMSYWGYLRRSTPNEVSVLFDENITDQTVTIWMVRDRAWIEAGNYKKKTATSTPGDGSFYDDISWVVYNGLSKGFIATYGTTKADGTTHTKPWFDANNPYQELIHTVFSSDTEFSISSEVTAYPESGGRFTTTVDDMVPFDKDHPMYVFDDKCVYTSAADAGKVTKIIIRATFNVTGDSDIDHDEHTKFFPLCISHGFNAEPLPLQRGHRYQLSLQTLPEAAGYDNFADAAAATTFANGALVDIPQSVIEVSDGSFNMRVNYMLTYPLSGESFSSTAVLIQKPLNATSQVTVPFEVKKESGDDREFDFSESAWLDTEEGTTPAYSSTSVSWIGLDANQHAKIGDTEEGYVTPLNATATFTLAPVEVDKLKESVYNLKGFYTTEETVVDQATGVSAQYDVKHILMRNIDVYSIDCFRIQEAYTSESTETVVHNDAHNLELGYLGDSKYRLKFKLPGGRRDSNGNLVTGDHDKYPEVLYPLQVKMATRTLQPTDIYINGVKQNNAVFGVQVLTTVPEKQPAMLSKQEDQTDQWNYQSPSNYWNFWYTYPIVSVPRFNGQAGEIQTGTTGDEIIGPEIWIDFMDVRNPSVFQTIPVNVGLYLYIEFFGAANAVSINAGYVSVTGVTVNPASGTSTTGHAANNRYSIRRSTNNYTSTLQLAATVTPAEATYKGVTWTSSNTERATVDGNGLVTITTAGTTGYGAVTQVNITATTIDGSKTNTFYLTVTNN